MVQLCDPFKCTIPKVIVGDKHLSCVPVANFSCTCVLVGAIKAIIDIYWTFENVLASATGGGAEADSAIKGTPAKALKPPILLNELSQSS